MVAVPLSVAAAEISKTPDVVSGHKFGLATTCDVLTPTDMTVMVKVAPDRLPDYERFPALDLDMPNARTSSPLVHVTHDDAALLLLAEDKNERVLVQHSRNIQAAFEKAQGISRLIEIEAAGHGFPPADQQPVTPAMVSWFEEHLTADVVGASQTQKKQ